MSATQQLLACQPALQARQQRAVALQGHARYTLPRVQLGLGCATRLAPGARPGVRGGRVCRSLLDKNNKIESARAQLPVCVEQINFSGAGPDRFFCRIPRSVPGRQVDLFIAAPSADEKGVLLRPGCNARRFGRLWLASLDLAHQFPRWQSRSGGHHQR